ncbi:MAG: adenylosuccinate lyase family protein [Chloroflexi bacterium]|nr:adenylosuccinate lyase family protein [Chloroflexota bacterium]
MRDQDRPEVDIAEAGSALDSPLYRDMFGTAAMRAVFAERAQVDCWVTIEAALARAQAAAGLIPADAATAIAAACDGLSIDWDALREGTMLVGYPILSLVRQIARAAGESAGGYVHWGATTQDIMDTATALQLASARRLITTDLDGLLAQLVALARTHRATPMAGRTHGQQALPITFGYKLAVLVAELRRHQARLAAAGHRAELVQFAGAAGTLASVGVAGLAVQDRLATALGLGVPPIAWHTSRDGIAEFVAVLALLGATLAKLAHEVAFLQRTEIAEVEEGYRPGRGGSSTMPQKRNPITCEAMIGANSRLRQLPPVMLDAMLHDGERATGPWHAEWLALPEACILAHGLVVQARALLAGLVVRPEAMRRNLALTGGLLNAEAVMMALAPALGRQIAHDTVYAAAMQAIATGAPFRDVLLATPLVAAHLDAATIDGLLAPAAYLGLATEMVDRVLAEES